MAGMWLARAPGRMENFLDSRAAPPKLPLHMQQTGQACLPATMSSKALPGVTSPMPGQCGA